MSIFRKFLGPILTTTICANLATAEPLESSKREKFDSYLKEKFQAEARPASYAYSATKGLLGLATGGYTSTVNSRFAEKMTLIRSDMTERLNFLEKENQRTLKRMDDNIRVYKNTIPAIDARADYIQRELDILKTENEALEVHAQDPRRALIQLRLKLREQYTAANEQLAHVMHDFQRTTELRHVLETSPENHNTNFRTNLENIWTAQQDAIKDLNHQTAAIAHKTSALNSAGAKMGLPPYIMMEKEKSFALQINLLDELEELKNKRIEVMEEITELEKNKDFYLQSHLVKVGEIDRATTAKIMKLTTPSAYMTRNLLQGFGAGIGALLVIDALGGFYIIATLDRDPNVSPLWTIVTPKQKEN